MKKQFIAAIVLISIITCLCNCSDSKASSYFSIQFIDVGQGDSALVECDGHCMLIDGGDTSAGEKVYSVLENKGIRHLDILAISHLHNDHIGGLPEALKNVTKIDLTISNATDGNKKTFRSLDSELSGIGSSIKIPPIGEKYSLGSASVEVVDNSAIEENDSLVLLVTYGKTKYLFTGDIGLNAQRRITDKYKSEPDSLYKIDLIKMPHHGSYMDNGIKTDTLGPFMRTFMADYAVISVGKGNPYKHPHKEVLDLLNSKTYKPKVYRTDEDGDIIVESDGKKLFVETRP